jgi:hypothetical protein
MTKHVTIALFFGIITLILLAGCVSPPDSNMTAPASSPTPAPVMISDDEVFLIETIRTSEDMATAAEIFTKSVTEMNTEISNVRVADNSCQNAVADLQQEQAHRSEIQADYAKKLAILDPSDEISRRSVKSEFDSAMANENKLIAAAQERVNSCDLARQSTITPMDFQSKGLDPAVLSTTSEKAIDHITPLPVSSDLQPIKDQYLSALSGFLKAGDLFLTGVNYYNAGKITESTIVINEATSDEQDANDQLDACRMRIQHYEIRPGNNASRNFF